MNRILFAIVLVLTATSLAPAQRAIPNPADACLQKHTEWIESVIVSINTIKPGMTRGELLKLFDPVHAGESNRFRLTYAYKQCLYIQVAVEFKANTKPEDNLREMPEDRIVKISAPFLTSDFATN